MRPVIQSIGGYKVFHNNYNDQKERDLRWAGR